MPECVSFWDTSDWKSLGKEFGLKETTFCQGNHGGAAVKPTTMAGTLGLNVEANKMKCVNPTDIKSRTVAVGTWNYGHGD